MPHFCVLVLVLVFQHSSSTRPVQDSSLWWRSSHSSLWSFWRCDSSHYLTVPWSCLLLNLKKKKNQMPVSVSPAEEDPSTLSGGTSGHLLPAGSLHLFQESQLPGGTQPLSLWSVIEYLVLVKGVCTSICVCIFLPGAAFPVWRWHELCAALAGAAHPQL